MLLQPHSPPRRTSLRPPWRQWYSISSEGWQRITTDLGLMVRSWASNHSQVVAENAFDALAAIAISPEGAEAVVAARVLDYIPARLRSGDDRVVRSADELIGRGWPQSWKSTSDLSGKDSQVSADNVNLDALELIFNYLAGNDLASVALVGRSFFAAAVFVLKALIWTLRILKAFSRRALEGLH
ncbi:hypothetical protein FB451DRAFT_1189489 [Mycena latifolia]|nr:hypothetical protein FB451DRAFT_1189489 [Mycena latifolia]